MHPDGSDNPGKSDNIFTLRITIVLHRACAMLRACLEKQWFTGDDRNAGNG